MAKRKIAASKNEEYKVFNYTDNIYASDEIFTTRKAANAFIKQFRKRYNSQGYYRDNSGNQIKPEHIDLEIIPADFNPYQKRNYNSPEPPVAGEITQENIDKYLDEFDIENLDPFERRQYDDFIKHSGKREALQIIINSVEGDLDQLSDELQKIAEMQRLMNSHEFGKGGNMPPVNVNESIATLRQFVPKLQIQYLLNIVTTEERDWGIELIQKLIDVWSKMPKTYDTEKIPTNEKIVYLHYFYGGSDWYIVEKDKEKSQEQAFGYVVLNGDTEMAEWGYISIDELKSMNQIELDFHWDPKPFSQVFGTDDNNDNNNENMQVPAGPSALTFYQELNLKALPQNLSDFVTSNILPTEGMALIPQDDAKLEMIKKLIEKKYPGALVPEGTEPTRQQAIDTIEALKLIADSDPEAQATIDSLELILNDLKDAVSPKKTTKSLGKKAPKLSVAEWDKIAVKYLKSTYGLDPSDLDIDINESKKAAKNGEDPKEYIDELARKHDLDKIS